MSVFRIEKTQNYTVMSNHHLRNAALSLKAKGLLSQMLSLPENWDYTLKGLSLINRESVDAIRTAIQELERAGYITRSRERNAKGQLGGAEYIIREQPIKNFERSHGTPPVSGTPAPDAPVSGNPALGNATQLNKDIRIKDLLNKDSIHFRSCGAGENASGRNGTEAASIQTFEVYRNTIRENIEYRILA